MLVIFQENSQGMKNMDFAKKIFPQFFMKYSKTQNPGERRRNIENNQQDIFFHSDTE